MGETACERFKTCGDANKQMRDEKYNFTSSFGQIVEFLVDLMLESHSYTLLYFIPAYSGWVIKHVFI